MKPGDLVLVHGTGKVSQLILFGEKLHDKDAYWSHAAMVADVDGGTIEAQAKGIVRGHVDKYNLKKIVDIGRNDEDRQKMLAFGEFCLKQHVRYGYLDDISIGIDLLSPNKFDFKTQNTLICSEFYARALEHTGWICPKLSVAHVMPEDLDDWYKKGLL